MRDVAGEDGLKKSQKLQVQTLASSILINEGNQQFKLLPLTGMAQLSPIFGIVTDDFDNDGSPDILAAGNFYDVKPDLGRMDARSVCFLKGNGKGSFEYIPSQNNGLEFQGQFRDVIMLAGKEKKKIVMGRNNDALLFLEKQ
jgi:hypothetical protein